MAMVVSSTHDHDLIHEKEDQISNLENFCRHEDDDHGGVNHNHNDDDDRDRGYEHNHPIWRSNSISSCCSQLDIPLDNLEDIEFFPNFGDDFMSLPRGHLEITSSFTPTTPAAAAVYYQSLSPSVGDAIHDYRDWYKFYSVDSTTNDQNRSIDQTAASLDRQNYKIFDEVINCDNQSMIMYDRNHTVDQSAAIDHQNNIFVHELSDNQSVMISTYDDQNRKSQYVEGYDNSTAAMLYGQDESGGFQKTKMRSKRARPRRPPPRSSTAGGSKRKCCTHCETELTPQWRMGPMGPNSLCNACGVRYQTRRLLPEYRPAASPTFDISKHSNFHKRILKKRKAAMIR